MGLISRTFTFVAGLKAKASEVNTELDTIVSEINGSLDNANIDVSAAIAESKIDGISGDETAARARTTPGTSGSPVLATSLYGEIQQLRQRIAQNGAGSSAKFIDHANAEQTAGWQDYPIRGDNLLTNSSFERNTTAAGTAPDGWANIDAPGIAILTTQTTSVSEGTGDDVRVVSHAAPAGVEGISQTVSNVKADTFYVIGVRTRSVLGDVHLTTSGALAAGNDFQDFDITTSNVSYLTLCGIVQTTGVPAPITVAITTDGNANEEYRADHAFMYELSPNPIGDEVPIDTSNRGFVYRTPDAMADTIATGTTGEYLDTAVTIPDIGEYTLTIHAHIYYDDTTASNNLSTAYIQEDIDGAATWPDKAGGNVPVRDTVCSLTYIETAPVNGSVYTYRVQVSNGGAGTIHINQNTTTNLSVGWESSMVVELRRIS